MPELAELPRELKPRAPILTAPQNMFCALIAKGYKKGDAWRRANPETRQDKAGCGVAASRLLRKPEIQARIKLEQDAIATAPPVITGCLERDQKRLILAGWVQDKALPHEIRLAALREDSALAGHNAPKVSVSLAPSLSVVKEVMERYATRQPARLPPARRAGGTPQAGDDVASPSKTFADIARSLGSSHPTEEGQVGGGSQPRGGETISPPLGEAGRETERRSTTEPIEVVAEVIQK